MPREKTAYIILRRRGYTISGLSRLFGRSTSVIRRILKVAEKRGVLRAWDLRKIPPRVRRLQRARIERTMVCLVRAWEAFMLGEGGKPP